MGKKTGVLMVVVCANIAMWPGGVSALPPAQRIELQFRSVPSDPTSSIEMQAVLYLSAESAGNNAIGWRINSIEFRRPIEGRSAQWSDQGVPTRDASDGLWWVHHADPDNPTTDEFTALLPSIWGNAEPLNNGLASLSFRIIGTATGIPESPYSKTAYAGYTFQEESEDDPVAEGDDEPVEISGHDPN